MTARVNVIHMPYRGQGAEAASIGHDCLGEQLHSFASPRIVAAEQGAHLFRAAREIGALTASLGGLDGLVFRAGIGEHASEIRSRICARIPADCAPR